MKGNSSLCADQLEKSTFLPSKPAATLTFKVWIIRIITLGTKLYSNDLILKAIKGAIYPKYFMIND